ncbi:hypothetical protein FPD46_03635 [Campylobacter peloridis]|uniref:Tram-like protein n=1 Tax=Campylobacter peloridis TaxID=488546 RepID=A0A5C7DWB1_9BACT|nr:hypothetical protein [Campylobacter peloridis]TXE82953.1 hypothetical protein FPD46_03635 [Campylobacter peloridis]
MNTPFNNILHKHEIVLKNFQELDICAFSKKKNLYCLFGEDNKDRSYLVLFSLAKSRILLKHILEIEKIISNIISHLNNTIFTNIVLFHQAPICSKAQKEFISKGFTSYAFM